MSFSILNNISSLMAQNQVSLTNAGLQQTLGRLASGSRINSGADDAAGLAISNGLNANIAALNQSVQNANSGIGLFQVADGALSQVSALLNRAVTLATEASNGTVSSGQDTAINSEFQNILTEVGNIGANTTYNGTSVFTTSVTTVFMSDGGTASSIGGTTGALSKAALGGSSSDFTSIDLTSSANAITALTALNTAVAGIASQRGTIGATINQLTAHTNVMNTQVQNLTSAVDGITAANIPQEVANMSKFQILTQTGMSALSQANQSQQAVLKLLQ
jgi:flagellin